MIDVWGTTVISQPDVFTQDVPELVQLCRDLKARTNATAISWNMFIFEDMDGIFAQLIPIHEAKGQPMVRLRFVVDSFNYVTQANALQIPP